MAGAPRRAALRFREDHHLDGLLAAVGLRYGADPDESARLHVRQRGLDGTVPNTATVPGSCTVTSPTSAALTRMVEPSTRSIVPRSLTVGACCPQAKDAASAATNTVMVSIRNVTCMFGFLPNVVIGCHACVEYDTLSRAASHRRFDALATGGEGRQTAL